MALPGVRLRMPAGLLLQRHEGGGQLVQRGFNPLLPQPDPRRVDGRPQGGPLPPPTGTTSVAKRSAMARHQAGDLESPPVGGRCFA